MRDFEVSEPGTAETLRIVRLAYSDACAQLSEAAVGLQKLLRRNQEVVSERDTLRSLATLQSARLIQLIDECKRLAKLDPAYNPDKGYFPPVLPSDVTYGTVCCKGCPDCVGIGIGYELAALRAEIQQKSARIAELEGKK